MSINQKKSNQNMLMNFHHQKQKKRQSLRILAHRNWEWFLMEPINT